jgi:hypothetical protein
MAYRSDYPYGPLPREYKSAFAHSMRHRFPGLYLVQENPAFRLIALNPFRSVQLVEQFLLSDLTRLSACNQWDVTCAHHARGT